jgi:hypothetical protein
MTSETSARETAARAATSSMVGRTKTVLLTQPILDLL